MIEVINANYTFKKTNDVYKLENLTSDETLTYSIYKEKCNEESELVLEGVILPEIIKTFDALKDGIYTLNILVDDISTHVYFNTYILLRSKFVSLIEKLLCCNCECNGSDETLFISKDCKTAIEFQSEYNYILTYFYSIKPLDIIQSQSSNPLLISYLETLFYTYKCNINIELCKQYFDDCLSGIDIATTLNKLELSLVYLSLYFYEKSLINIDEVSELIYLNEKYDFIKVSKCIQKLGIYINEVEDTLDIIFNNLYKPNHVSNIFYNTDFTTIAVMFKSLFLLNYKDINNSPPKYIKFYNLATLFSTIRLGANLPVVDNIEYNITSYNVLGVPIVNISGITNINDSALDSTYAGRFLTIKSPISPNLTEVLQYGFRNSLSENYTNGSITINII